MQRNGEDMRCLGGEGIHYIEPGSAGSEIIHLNLQLIIVVHCCSTTQ